VRACSRRAVRNQSISVNSPSRTLHRPKMANHGPNHTDAPAKSRARRVHFPLLLKRSTPPDALPSSRRSLSFGSSDHERTPLLQLGDDLEGGVFDAREQEVTCTPKCTFITVLVILGTIGCCVAAVFLGVGSKMPCSSVAVASHFDA
jgi:hypothetical protein